MVRPDRDKLAGAARAIEVDKTYVGGVSRGGPASRDGRGAEKKFILARAVELHEPKGFVRVRMRHVPDAEHVPCSSHQPRFRLSVTSSKSAPSFAPTGNQGTTPCRCTDTAAGVLSLSASDRPSPRVDAGGHQVNSLLKRWLLDTHQQRLPHRDQTLRAGSAPTTARRRARS